jgi:hypothetical protein
MWLALALQAAASGNADAAIDRYRELTAPEVRCVYDPQSTDITVCGLRSADRYRVPFAIHEAGDPLWEPVGAERERYLARTSNCQEKSTFLVGCGSVGVSVKAGAGREGITLRPMAK